MDLAKLAQAGRERQRVCGSGDDGVGATVQDEHRRTQLLGPSHRRARAQSTIRVGVEAGDQATRRREATGVRRRACAAQVGGRAHCGDREVRRACPRREQRHHATARIAEREHPPRIDIGQRLPDARHGEHIAHIGAPELLPTFATIVAPVLRTDDDIPCAHEAVESELGIRPELRVFKCTAAVEDEQRQTVAVARCGRSPKITDHLQPIAEISDALAGDARGTTGEVFGFREDRGLCDRRRTHREPLRLRGLRFLAIVRHLARTVVGVIRVPCRTGLASDDAIGRGGGLERAHRHGRGGEPERDADHPGPDTNRHHHLSLRSVRHSVPPADAAHRLGLQRILGPVVARIPPAHVLAYLDIGVAPEARQIGGHLQRSLCRRQQLEGHG